MELIVSMNFLCRSSSNCITLDGFNAIKEFQLMKKEKKTFEQWNVLIVLEILFDYQIEFHSNEISTKDKWMMSFSIASMKKNEIHWNILEIFDENSSAEENFPCIDLFPKFPIIYSNLCWISLEMKRNLTRYGAFFNQMIANGWRWNILCSLKKNENEEKRFHQSTKWIHFLFWSSWHRSMCQGQTLFSLSLTFFSE